MPPAWIATPPSAARDDGTSSITSAGISVRYEDLHLESAYRADIVAAGQVLLELKSVEHILPVHEAQTLTYLRLSGCKMALLMNFNAVMLKDGLRCFVIQSLRSL